MKATFKPTAQQFATPIRIQHRTMTEVDGSTTVGYLSSPELDFCSWKGKGGTDGMQTDTIVVFDTAEVTMWFRPDISLQDRVLLNDDETQAYEIMNIENIEMRNMWLVLKVKREQVRTNTVKYRHLVMIQRREVVRDDEAMMSERWVSIASSMGAVVPISGREYMAQAAIKAQLTTRIEIPYLPGVEASMRVQYGERVFNIVNVIDVEERNVEIHLMCTEVQSGGG